MSKKIEQLFNDCVASLKEVGYFNVYLEDGTGRLVACYTPSKETLEQSSDPEYMLGRSWWQGRFKEFDLVVADWEEKKCVPHVVIEPESRCSPGRIYHSGGPVGVSSGGASSAIKAIGELALASHIG